MSLAPRVRAVIVGEMVRVKYGYISVIALRLLVGALLLVCCVFRVWSFSCGEKVTGTGILQRFYRGEKKNRS